MRRWLVLAASVAILVILARAAGFETIGLVWRTVDPRGVMISVTCWAFSLAVRILSWHRLLGPDAPPFRALTPPLALGFVLSNVAPAKTGEPAAALLLRRSLDVPLPRALSVLTAERSAHVLTLLATFASAAALTAGGEDPLSKLAHVAAWLLLATCIAAVFARPLLRRAETLTARLPRVGAAAAAYVAALRMLLGEPRRLIPLLGLSLAFWFLQYASLFAILRAGGAGVNLAQAAVVAGSAILGGTVSLLPLGTQDAISAVALDRFGVPLERGFALALFHSGLGLACGGLLAAALALRAARQKNGSPSAP